jgi:hypothetical protein
MRCIERKEGSMGNSSLSLRLALILLCVIGPSITFSAEMKLKVDQMDFCAAVRERSPIGVADSFPSDISAIYCFTRVAGAQDTTAVVHRWFRGETRVVDVDLPVCSGLWRTWSRKRMLPGWQGQWHVDVVDPDGSVIASKRFFLR